MLEKRGLLLMLFPVLGRELWSVWGVELGGVAPSEEEEWGALGTAGEGWSPLSPWEDLSTAILVSLCLSLFS